MPNVINGSVIGYKEIKVPYTIFSNTDDARGLAILIPGGGYTTQRPAFHYAAELFLSKSYDVLCVDYQYLDAIYDSFSIEEMDQAVVVDTKTVIDKVLEEYSSQYEDYYLIGKSIGTIAMSSELKREIFKDAKAIWLTPLLKEKVVFNTMFESKNSGLCFTGDNDRHFDEGLFNDLKNNKNIDSKLIPGINHSLQYDDKVLESIDVMRSITEDIGSFIND